MTTTTIARLIESVGHVGQIDDFPIKPLEQYSFLLTGFSRQTPCRLSSKGMTASATATPSILMASRSALTVLPLFNTDSRQASSFRGRIISVLLQENQ